MAIQSFFRPRRPRSFAHKYIYWDPRQDALEKRVQRIRRELIEAGEIDGAHTDHVDVGQEQYDAGRIRGRFVRGTDHLQRQIDSGESRHDRRVKNNRLMLLLLGLGFAIWYLFLR